MIKYCQTRVFILKHIGGLYKHQNASQQIGLRRDVKILNDFEALSDLGNEDTSW
jgi:hypothetical protein